MRNLNNRLKRLEDVIGRYNGRVTIFKFNETLKEQIKQHNLKYKENLNYEDVLKWKKMETNSEDWLLSPNWSIEEYLFQDKDDDNE